MTKQNRKREKDLPMYLSRTEPLARLSEKDLANKLIGHQRVIAFKSWLLIGLRGTQWKSLSDGHASHLDLG